MGNLGMGRCGPGLVWCAPQLVAGRGMVWCDAGWSGVMWDGLVWGGMVWCDVVWSGVGWFGMVLFGVAPPLCSANFMEMQQRMQRELMSNPDTLRQVPVLLSPTCIS